MHLPETPMGMGERTSPPWRDPVKRLGVRCVAPVLGEAPILDPWDVGSQVKGSGAGIARVAGEAMGHRTTHVRRRVQVESGMPGV